MTKRTLHALFLAALAVLVVGLLVAGDAKAQQPCVYYPGTVVYSGWEVHHHRVYRGSTWHWSPWLGWHRHDHYVDVPHWVPVICVDRPVSQVPIVVHYSR